MGMLFINGILLAMDTLVSQAKGAGNLEQCGVILNRSRLIVLLLYLLMVVLSFQVENAYLYIDLDPVSAAYAQKYVSVQVCGMFFWGQNAC